MVRSAAYFLLTLLHGTLILTTALAESYQILRGWRSTQGIRRGIGGYVLVQATDEADAKEWQCFVDASLEGVQLHKKAGFKIQE